MNKKLLIPVFSTIMGLSVIGGISGSIAWYQYNSKVSASYIGTSVADTGVLQISNDGSTWDRDVDITPSNLYPVTFGELAGEVPNKGYMYPESGIGAGYSKWLEAKANTHYAQFDLYFNAYQTKDDQDDEGIEYVERDVYLSDYYLECLNNQNQVIDTKIAKEAIRVQLDVENGSSTLLSEDGGETALSGELDLDGSGATDVYHGTVFNPLPQGKQNGDPMIYGNDGETQESKSFSSMKAERTNGFLTEDSDKILFKTSGDKDNPVHVKVSVWLEGWAILSDSADNTAIWNAFTAGGCKVQLAMQFDTGMFRGADLTQYGA